MATYADISRVATYASHIYGDDPYKTISTVPTYADRISGGNLHNHIYGGNLHMIINLSMATSNPHDIKL
jgi:hypothetical protein